MTGNLKLLINFISKFMGTVRFGNDHVAAILGFGQFCDYDLEVAFRRDACFVRNLVGVDLLKRDCSTNLYTINLHEMASASLICLMARACSTKSWLWHQRLSHLNFDTINDLARNDLIAGLPKFKYHKEHLCPSCKQGKSKRASHLPKPVPNSRQRLHLLHMDLCGPMRIASINGKRYVLVIVDDYSRYTWVHFLRSKDEAPEFWTSAKVRNVNGEAQIQALVDKMKVVITEASIRRDIRFEDEGGVDCLSNEVIFEQLTLMGHNPIFVISSHTKKVFANIKREGKGFSGVVTPLFKTMMVQAPEYIGGRLMKDIYLHGVFRYIILMKTKLLIKKLEDSEAKTAQAKEIASLKKRVKKLEQKRKSRTSVLKRLRKVGITNRVESLTEASLVDETYKRLNEEEMFGLNDLDGDEVIMDATACKNVEQSAKVAKKEVSTADLVTTAGEVVTTASVEVTTAATTPQISKDELTLAQTLIKIKAAKPKVITTAATIVTASTRPKGKRIVMQEPSETPLPKPIDYIASENVEQSAKVTKKEVSTADPVTTAGKGKMVEPKRPLKRKDQIMMDAEVDKNLEAQMQVELEEEERLARLKEEETNIALIESWDNTQAMIDANYELAQRLQTEEHRELSIEERSRLFVELMDKRKKHFARLRAEKTEAFVPMDTELVKGSEKAVEGSEKAKEGSSKRVGDNLEHKDAKRDGHDLLRLIRKQINKGYVPE
nr:integrase, catalytic region, zinc finger, CCHC-type, peptidase aspartic, catalytic [Tanacetum cinerariifolium]